MTSMDSFFAACMPGLEPLLLEEAAALGLSSVAASEGGVSFQGDAEACYRANFELGLASHVLLRLAEFPVRHFAELVKKTAKIEWAPWLDPKQPVRIRAQSRRSKLWHSKAVEERVRKGIEARLGGNAIAGDAPGNAPKDAVGVMVLVRIVEDRCTVSIDTSGEPLHRRGYRWATGKAPVREDLARALLLTSGWDRESPVVDPMMGSGTLVIEAALLGRQLPPGRLRPFAFESFPSFDRELWGAVRERALAAAKERMAAPIFGSDRDDGAVRAATENAERAGVLADLRLSRAALLDAPFRREALPPRGAFVTNPPHGRRIGGGRDLRPLYQTLGKVARDLPPEWRVALLSSDRRLALTTGLSLSTAALVDQGGEKARLLVGSARPAT